MGGSPSSGLGSRAVISCVPHRCPPTPVPQVTQHSPQRCPFWEGGSVPAPLGVPCHHLLLSTPEGSPMALGTSADWRHPPPLPASTLAGLLAKQEQIWRPTSTTHTPAQDHGHLVRGEMRGGESLCRTRRGPRVSEPQPHLRKAVGGMPCTSAHRGAQNQGPWGLPLRGRCQPQADPRTWLHTHFIRVARVGGDSPRSPDHW